MKSLLSSREDDVEAKVERTYKTVLHGHHVTVKVYTGGICENPMHWQQFERERPRLTDQRYVPWGVKLTRRVL